MFESCATLIPLKPHEGPTKYIDNYNRFTAYDVTDGVVQAQLQNLADTQTTFTPGEVEVATWLPGSTQRRTADVNILKQTSRILMNALGLKQDQDGGLQMVNWTPIIGAASRVLGAGEYLAASTNLAYGNNRSNPEPPPLPWWTIDHPIKLSTVAGRMIPLTDVPGGGSSTIYLPASTSRGMTVGAGALPRLAEDIVRMGPFRSLKELFGIPVKPSANIIPDSADDVSGASFSQEGFIYVNEVAPQIDVEVPIGARGARQLTAWRAYVFGLYRAGAFGVEILGDASVPTS